MRVPRVSVIIPVHNYAHFIGDALGSVQIQEAACEVIVVDDGSTDELDAALEPWRGDIRLIRQPKQGLCAARNAGLQAAKGTYVVFLDADDLLGEKVLTRQVAKLDARGGQGVAVSRSRFFKEQDRSGNPVETGEWRRFNQRLNLHLLHFNIAPVHAMALSTAVARKIGGFDTTLQACEDHDFWVRALAAGHDPFPGTDSVVWYRQHGASMSNNTKNQHRHDREMHLRIFDLIRHKPAWMAEYGLEAYLACAAGMILTATRLHPAERAPMVDALKSLLKDLVQCTWVSNMESEFFLTRCLHFLPMLIDMNPDVSDVKVKLLEVGGRDNVRDASSDSLEKMVQKMTRLSGKTMDMRF